MKNLPHAFGFQDLLVYQKARQLSRQVFQLTSTFPKDEMFSLTSQIRRSSRSIGANVAEAWGKHRYENHFISKLTDADSEQLETQHWIGTVVACHYWNTETANSLQQQCEEKSRLLNGMIAKSSMFCGESARTMRESSAEYFINNTSDQ